MPGQGLQFLPLSRIPEKWDRAWFASFIKDALALADARNALGDGVEISGQPGEVATFAVSADIQALLGQTFVLAQPSGFLQFERTLAGESGVIQIIDGGPDANITVELINNGITLGKLKKLSGAGILGNPVDAIGEVQNINPEQALSVLHFDGTGIVFDLIDHNYISDFNAAAKAAVDFRYVRGASWISGTALTAGANVVYARVSRTGTIARVTLLAGTGTGSCVVDVRSGTFAAYPTVASICAAAKPTISSGIKYEDATLTGWTTAVTAGDILAFVIESTSTFTQLSIELEIAAT